MYLFNGADEVTFKSQLDHRTELRVERIAKVVGLTGEQIVKLKLAAHGDLCRFYRDMALVRDKTKGLNPQVAGDMQQAWKEIMPLQQRMAKGIVEEDSLYEKVLASTLTAEQEQSYRDYVREREIAEIRALFRVTLADMEKSLPLTAKQRAELIKLVESQDLPGNVPKSNLYMVGYAILARLPAGDTTAIFDEHQEKTFDQLRKSYQRYAASMRW
jgi:hypothetical protein